jgi:histidinol-phosphatase (PHP family)
MLDYHVHLWPHEESSVWFQLDQIAQYCDEAARHGVSELALTEHAHRFVDIVDKVGPFWLRHHEPTSAAMAEYIDFHARNSLEAYVTLAQRAKDEGLPVKIGLEVDYVRDSMGVIAGVLDQYPFDVLIGSVHWLGTWQFDDLSSSVQMNEWTTRVVDEVWRDYATNIEELSDSHVVDVLAHPDLIKVAGHVASSPDELWSRVAEAALRADVSLECSSAGWKKPVAEQYPSEGMMNVLVERELTFTTASDAHRLERVGERAHDIADLLASRGVHELASYERRQRRMVPLHSAP